jgi:hypothetical protein
MPATISNKNFLKNLMAVILILSRTTLTVRKISSKLISELKH